MATRIVTINICDRCRKDLPDGYKLSTWSVRRTAGRGGKNYRIELCESCVLMFKSFLGEVEVNQLKDQSAPRKRKPRKAADKPDGADEAALLAEVEAEAEAAKVESTKRMSAKAKDEAGSPFAIAS